MVLGGEEEWRQTRRKISAEEKYLVCQGVGKKEKEKEENTRWNIFFAKEKKQRGNRRKILGEGKSSFGDDENNGERKG